MATKATHTGICQLCGSRQMLPKGRLAAHGYTKELGFFNGTCRGSHGLPFEQSIDLIEAAIANSKAVAKAAREEAAAVRANTDPAEVYYQAYERLGRSSGYTWVKASVIPHAAWPIYNSDIVYKWGNETKSTIHRSNVADTVAHLNERYAVSRESIAKQHEGYVEWQTKRVAGWKPAELTPRG